MKLLTYIGLIKLLFLVCFDSASVVPDLCRCVGEWGMLQEFSFDRYLWADAIMTWLPSVPYHNVMVMTSSTDYVKEARVLITSYDLMTRRQKELKEMHFGVCIMVIRLWKEATRMLQLCFLSNSHIECVVCKWVSHDSCLIFSHQCLYSILIHFSLKHLNPLTAELNYTGHARIFFQFH